MSIEATQGQAITQTARDAFQYWTGSRDEAQFRRAYLGHYADRNAFGQELLARLGADARLARLPDWLRAYIHFDGDAVVRDFEAAGQFHIVDVPAGGSFVFDAYEQPENVVE
jgi:hypothetical protein